MWNHTNAVHGGVVGNDRGLLDYRFVLLDRYRDCLSRQSSEGFRQLQIEKKQSQNRAVCLNSKIDYIKPFKTHLSVNRGNINSGPGVPGTTSVYINSTTVQYRTRRQLTHIQTETASNNLLINSYSEQSGRVPGSQPENSPDRPADRLTDVGSITQQLTDVGNITQQVTDVGSIPQQLADVGSITQ